MHLDKAVCTVHPCTNLTRDLYSDKIVASDEKTSRMVGGFIFIIVLLRSDIVLPFVIYMPFYSRYDKSMPSA